MATTEYQRVSYYSLIKTNWRFNITQKKSFPQAPSQLRPDLVFFRQIAQNLTTQPLSGAYANRDSPSLPSVQPSRNFRERQIFLVLRRAGTGFAHHSCIVVPDNKDTPPSQQRLYSDMTILIIQHVDIEGPGLIEDCLREEQVPYQILNLERCVHLPKPRDCRGIIILGGPMNVYEEDRYPFLREEDLFIKEAIQRGKVVLGICLGAQLMAKALGAKVTKAPVKEIGWYSISLTEAGARDPVFVHFPKTFPVFQWHEDTFELPSAGELIATSNPVPHQAFRYGDSAYGLQFHLEVTEEMILEWMKTYEEEFDASHTPLVSKLRILCETKRNIGAYRKRGIKFFKNFLTKIGDHGPWLQPVDKWRKL